MSDHKIIYHPSFVFFWGLILSVITIYADLLYLAYALTCLLILISHEHAHAAACIKNGVSISAIEFTFWGGMVVCDIDHNISSSVEIITAGVKDTACYAVGFSSMFFIWSIIGHLFSGGSRFLIIPEIDYLSWCAQFSVLVFFANIIPGTYKHARLGNIRTDGWAAWKMVELRNELWNDGRIIAIKEVTQ